MENDLQADTETLMQICTDTLVRNLRLWRVPAYVMELDLRVLSQWYGKDRVFTPISKLSGEKEILQGIADRYNRLLRMLGKDMVERLVQDDIRMQTELEAKKQKEQMPQAGLP